MRVPQIAFCKFIKLKTAECIFYFQVNIEYDVHMFITYYSVSMQND